MEEETTQSCVFRVVSIIKELAACGRQADVLPAADGEHLSVGLVLHATRHQNLLRRCMEPGHGQHVQVRFLPLRSM